MSASGPKVDVGDTISRILRYRADRPTDSILPVRAEEADALIARVRELEAENERLIWESAHNAVPDAEREMHREDW